ncbi:hypothetical protein AB395_00002489 [Sinorhizobium fredii CCBAU 45436]|nr:hypothetical protein AB395_00002489 [Sinorhizobium fredii CCBAU 45436]AWM25980.1 hypothetical protein AOX55_00002731 [Sinorhizobium fredii CCBAU 25509]
MDQFRGVVVFAYKREVRNAIGDSDRARDEVSEYVLGKISQVAQAPFFGSQFFVRDDDVPVI